MISAGTLTVSELNTYIKSMMTNDDTLSNVLVKGEISGFKHHTPSGHIYFSLKDGDSVIKAVMFKGQAVSLAFAPENGHSVIVSGSVSVFIRDGTYQIYVTSMVRMGVGDLSEALERLKLKLADKGMFSERLKKPLPRFPEVVGIVTSKAGAAFYDITSIIERRYPLCKIILRPVAVQGETAAVQIAEAIKAFNHPYRGAANGRGSTMPDVMIVGRGGGSAEELRAWNEEIVAQAIFDSVIPVISAVGHETDFTIADFVADRRAATPSEAAELAVPDISDIKRECDRKVLLMRGSVVNKYERQERRYLLSVASPQMRSLSAVIDKMSFRTASLSEKLISAINNKAERRERALSSAAGMLGMISPVSVLARGYSIVSKDGKVVSASDGLAKNDIIDITFANGTATAIVTDADIREE